MKDLQNVEDINQSILHDIATPFGYVIAPFIGVADLITDLTSTGTTLKMNHLKIVDTILESSIKLIANKDSNATKKQIIMEAFI